MSTFRFNAKRLFATYPQANNLTKENIYDFYKRDLLAKTCIIGQESHADTGKHFHCYVEWERAYCTRSARCFDIQDNHPNIQSVRDKTAVLKYVQKEGDCYGDIGDILGHAGKRKLAECENEPEFWELARTEYPRDYVLNMEKLEYYCSKKFKQNHDHYHSEYNIFKPTTELEQWIEQYLNQVGKL